MLQPSYTRQFEKDFKKNIKRGRKPEKIKKVMSFLIDQKALPLKYKDHKLIGNYLDRRECHIESDWLLIYKVSGNEIIFERTGSHSDLFKS